MYFLIDESTAGDRTLFTPSSVRRFRVTGYHLVAAGAVAVTWKRGATAMGGAWTFATGVPHSAVRNSLDCDGIFEGDTGEALVLSLSGSVQVSGWVGVDHV